MRAYALLSATALAGLLATPAWAGWETIRAPRAVDRNCQAPHNEGPWLYLKSSDNRALQIADGQTVEVEIYGHGIDASPDAKLEGIPGDRSADRVRGHGGAVNGARGCGNIGSVVVRIKVPSLSGPNTGFLIVGSERIPIRVVTKTLSNVKWADSNRADGQGAPQAGPGGAAAPAQPPPVTGGSGPCIGVNCPPPMSTFTTRVGDVPPGTPAGLVLADDRTLSRCIDGFGGRGEISGDRLTVTLPDQRGGDVGRCFDRHFLVEYDATAPDADIAGGKPPAITAGVMGATPLASFAPQEGREGDNARVRLPSAFLTGLVGEYDYVIEPQPGSAKRLSLRVRSTPLYGVQAALAPYTPLGRSSSSYNVTVRLFQPSRGGQPLEWSLARQGAGPSVGQCFVAVSGTLTPPSGASSAPIELTVRERSECYGPSFVLTVAPPQRTGDTVLFGKSVAFVLAPLARPIDAPGPLPRANIPGT